MLQISGYLIVYSYIDSFVSGMEIAITCNLPFDEKEQYDGIGMNPWDQWTQMCEVNAWIYDI